MSAKNTSTAYTSKISQIHHHSDEGPLPDSQHNTKIIRNIAFLIAFLLLVFSLFFSWSSARKLVFDSIYFLTYCKILTIGTLQAMKVSNLLTNFEIISVFFSQMSQPLQQIQCNKYDITNLIKFCQTVHKYSINPISDFRITYSNFTSCRIAIDHDDSSKFNLIYFTEYNQTYLQSYYFNENSDYDNWNPIAEDAFYNYFNKDIFRYKGLQNKTQFWENEVNFHGNSEWNQLLAIHSVFRQNNTINKISSVCLEVKDLFDSLIAANYPIQSHFALLRTQKSDVILTSDLGISNSLGFESGTFVPIFPPLSQLNSTFWRLISVAISGKDYNQAVFINTTDSQWKNFEKGDDWNDDLDGSRYAAVRSRVTSTTNTRYDIITVIKIDETITDYFFAPTIIFIGLWTIIAFIYILSRIILRYAIRKYRSDKIEIINISSSTLNESLIIKNNDSSLYPDTNTSTIWKAVNSIRNYQINYPDDINMNKAFDDVVFELTQPKERLFSISANRDCKFCSHLVKHQSSLSNKSSSSNHLLDSLALSSSSSVQKAPKNKKNEKSNDEQTYEIWKILSKQYSFDIDEIPDWKIIKNDPIKSLIFAYIDVIQQFNLAIPEFDPDILIQFMIEFSSKYISYHFYTIFIFHHLVSLLAGPFNNWLLQKIDIFILFFIAFTKDINIDSFKDEFPTENTEKEDSLIQKKYLIFNDKYSKAERKLEFILTIFYKFFPTCAKSKYFEENVREIFNGIQNFNRNELFSTFQCRIQSPDFNVHSDIYDKRIFVKSILTICSQWPYFSSEELMLKSLKNLNSILFHNFNEPNSIPSYHYYYADLFVKPWIELFNQFSPLPELMKKVNNSILYWKKVIENESKS